MTEFAKPVEEVRIRVANDKREEFSLVVEPWGDVHTVRPNDEYVIVATGPAPAAPELVQSGDHVTYYGWAGSTLELFLNGKSVESLDEKADEEEPANFSSDYEKAVRDFIVAYWSSNKTSRFPLSDSEAGRSLALLLLLDEGHRAFFKKRGLRMPADSIYGGEFLEELDDFARDVMTLAGVN
jgi:hypothetical protein